MLPIKGVSQYRRKNMEWISAKERLPEKDCVCIIWNDSRPFQYYISIYDASFKEFEVYMIGMSRLNDPITFNATYWMALKPPKD